MRWARSSPVLSRPALILRNPQYKWSLLRQRLVSKGLKRKHSSMSDGRANLKKLYNIKVLSCVVIIWYLFQPLFPSASNSVNGRGRSLMSGIMLYGIQTLWPLARIWIIVLLFTSTLGNPKSKCIHSQWGMVHAWTRNVLSAEDIVTYGLKWMYNKSKKSTRPRKDKLWRYKTKTHRKIARESKKDVQAWEVC